MICGLNRLVGAISNFFELKFFFKIRFIQDAQLLSGLDWKDLKNILELLATTTMVV